MERTLVMRVVADDHLRRVSIYLQPDRTYRYVEEHQSAPEDSAAVWGEAQKSDGFGGARQAMREAKSAIGWLRHAAVAGLPPTQMAWKHPRTWRAPADCERALLLHLLRGDFPGRAEILEQVTSLEVMRLNPQGSLICRTSGPLAAVEDSDAPSLRPNDRIPVEGFYDDEIAGRKRIFRLARLVRLALHVTEGKLSELEIYKENGRPILNDPYEIDLSRIHFY